MSYIDPQIDSILQQRYSCPQQFFNARRVSLPKDEKFPWRLTKRILGQINGLPSSQGVLTATNGILCFIESLDLTADKQIKVFCGHLQWFVPEDVKDISEVKDLLSPGASQSKPTKQSKLAKILELY